MSENESTIRLINLAKENPGVEFTISPWHDGEWYVHWELTHDGHIRCDASWQESFTEAVNWLTSEVLNINKAQKEDAS